MNDIDVFKKGEIMELELLGINKAKINQFNKKGIFSIEDLARFFPRKYYDFRNITPISQVKDGEILAVVGKIIEINTTFKMIRVKIRDSYGKYMYVIWFNSPYLADILEKDKEANKEYIFCGKIQVDEKYHSKRMISPLYYGTKISEYQTIIPVYSKIKGMSDSFLKQSIDSAIALVNKNDYLEPIMLNKFKIAKTSIALRAIHQPKTDVDLKIAKKRFIFDDLFEFGMKLEHMQQSVNKTTKYKMPKHDITDKFISQLSFKLTNGQRDALNAIYKKMRAEERVNALVQGDVGCGKTIVAIILMLIACENGYQSALMTPTNVLAKQHYHELLERLKDMPYSIAFLSGETKAKEKKEILKKLELGEINIIVGTHAVIQKEVKFKNLALTVVDEEHRFGVVQRNQLLEKSKEGVHNITMSATPIPRTLAMTIYGNALDVLNITTLPNGRKPIVTIQVKNEDKAYEAMYRQINEGRQCYVVCPLIEDSEWEGLEDVDSVETTYKKMTEYFKKYPEVNISMISGKMKQKEVGEEIDKFSKNEYQIIISTTIIEVGVNVPNASVILIKNAERFGLSQLHQLRGRVGRGIHQSYCVLLSDKKDNPKLHAMCEIIDGFKIAEKDLELRGTGDFIGTKQSGQNKFVMLMLSYPKFFEKIKYEISEICKDKIRFNRYSFINNIETVDIFED
ncbi:MAG: ATP-dependent helicase RecG [Clostridiaceae bacterium]|jgi:ATP-dependent DNA helicase RecG|nr:ATP-dependent helicase RecG [Clostridiaceae bacterium]